MNKFNVIIVEDVPLELKGTEGIFKTDIPEAQIIGTAESEVAYWRLIKQQIPDLVLAQDILKADGVLVFEHGKGHDFSAHPNFVEHRAYGSVNFSILRATATTAE